MIKKNEKTFIKDINNKIATNKYVIKISLL